MRLQLYLLSSCMGVAAGVTFGRLQPSRCSDTLRTERLEIVDAAGQARIVLSGEGKGGRSTIEFPNQEGSNQLQLYCDPSSAGVEIRAGEGSTVAKLATTPTGGLDFLMQVQKQGCGIEFVQDGDGTQCMRMYSSERQSVTIQDDKAAGLRMALRNDNGNAAVIDFPNGCPRLRLLNGYGSEIVGIEFDKDGLGHVKWRNRDQQVVDIAAK